MQKCIKKKDTVTPYPFALSVFCFKKSIEGCTLKIAHNQRFKNEHSHMIAIHGLRVELGHYEKH